MTWHARLQLDYTLEAERCVLRHQHSGPLRILQSLYPEGDSVCHNVLVHPPGGLVGGDTLDISATVGPGAHGLLTTPGATRFYRSAGERALQRTELTLADGARLEWLPLEALCYDACRAENRLTMHLAPGAGLLGWDVTALGLPGASMPFARGQFQQHLEVPGLWLERGLIDAADTRLLEQPAVPGRPPLPGLGVLRRRQPAGTRGAPGRAGRRARGDRRPPPGRHRRRHQPERPGGHRARAGAPGGARHGPHAARARGLARPFLATATDAAADLGDVVRSTQAGHPASHCHPWPGDIAPDSGRWCLSAAHSNISASR
jgi:hypothetical protein